MEKVDKEEFRNIIKLSRRKTPSERLLARNLIKNIDSSTNLGANYKELLEIVTGIAPVDSYTACLIYFVNKKYEKQIIELFIEFYCELLEETLNNPFKGTPIKVTLNLNY